MGYLVPVLAYSLRARCLVLVEGEEVSEQDENFEWEDTFGPDYEDNSE